MEKDKVLARVVYSDDHPSVPAPPVKIANVDDQTLVRQGVGAFLKVFDDIKLRDDAALQLSAQSMPGVVVIDEDEFNKMLAAQEARHRKTNPGLVSAE